MLRHPVVTYVCDYFSMFLILTLIRSYLEPSVPRDFFFLWFCAMYSYVDSMLLQQTAYKLGFIQE